MHIYRVTLLLFQNNLISTASLTRGMFGDHLSIMDTVYYSNKKCYSQEIMMSMKLVEKFQPYILSS
jgi:hypothetical protein